MVQKDILVSILINNFNNQKFLKNALTVASLNHIKI